MNTKQFLSDILDEFNRIDYVKPEDIPNIDLYMDQVTTFMDSQLATSKRHEDDKILTKTMINNYAKNDLLPPPEKKKYSKDHLILLMMIFYLKNIISINDIDTALSPLIKDYFNDGNNSLEEIFKLFIQYMKDTDDNQSIIDAYVKSNEYFSNLDNEDNKEIKTDIENLFKDVIGDRINNYCDFDLRMPCKKNDYRKVD